MTTRTDLVTRLRQELGDETAPYIWSDGYLANLIIEANDWYSRLYPRSSVAYQDVATGDREFTLTDGNFGVLHVECPPGREVPRDAVAYDTDPTPYTGSLRQSYAVFGGVLYLRNDAAGEEVGASKLVIFQQLAWDRPDPADPWNGPQSDERLLVLWAAREAWLWLDGQNQRRQNKVGQYTQAARFGAMLDDELKVRARRSSFASRTMEVAE